MRIRNINFTTLRSAFELTTGEELSKFSLAGNSEAAAAVREKQGAVFSLEPVLRREYFLGKLYLEYQSSVRSRFLYFVCGESLEPTINVGHRPGWNLCGRLWTLYIAGATGVLNQVGEEVGPHLRLTWSCFTGVFGSS